MDNTKKQRTLKTIKVTQESEKKYKGGKSYLLLFQDEQHKKEGYNIFRLVIRVSLLRFLVMLFMIDGCIK